MKVDESYAINIVNKYARISIEHKHIEVTDESKTLQLPINVQLQIKKLLQIGYHLQLTID